MFRRSIPLIWGIIQALHYWIASLKVPGFFLCYQRILSPPRVLGTHIVLGPLRVLSPVFLVWPNSLFISFLNLFISLIGFKRFIHLITYLFLFLTYLFHFDWIKENPLKEPRCSFKIDKITYSKSQSITVDVDSKNKPSLYP